ncbi:hypothetical protein [Pseudomonas chlororaphis]|uniref:Uncharacterized protein n=1 Tax=Pseudomonas chlororaphis TaxID=587753 RepID=A0A0D5Y068_9PSED|nr:hypothetical protein [Pseudomonas chlororaphis]AKA24369.1 hypothetical protein PCL1606_29180 [Pseudomonas chlororaphis]
MYSPHQRFQLRACRAFALEQNQRLFRHARALSAQAFALLDDARLDSETFEQYRHLRDKAEARFQEAIEHLRLINRDFADHEPRPPRHYPPKPLPLQHTGR